MDPRQADALESGRQHDTRLRSGMQWTVRLLWLLPVFPAVMLCNSLLSDYEFSQHGRAAEAVVVKRYERMWHRLSFVPSLRHYIVYSYTVDGQAFEQHEWSTNTEEFMPLQPGQKVAIEYRDDKPQEAHMRDIGRYKTSWAFVTSESNAWMAALAFLLLVYKIVERKFKDIVRMMP